MLQNINVIIYTPSKTAMQSATKKSLWYIKFPPDQTKFNYELMNWTGSKDTKQQLSISFASKEQAINFAEKNNWKYQIKEPKVKIVKAKSYADNFVN
ncbi:MAG: NADH dehydrogenase ubiquinone Fe-S protein 4 [Rickettsiales bacterium]